MVWRKGIPPHMRVTKQELPRPRGKIKKNKFWRCFRTTGTVYSRTRTSQKSCRLCLRQISLPTSPLVCSSSCNRMGCPWASKSWTSWPLFWSRAIMLSPRASSKGHRRLVSRTTSTWICTRTWSMRKSRTNRVISKSTQWMTKIILRWSSTEDLGRLKRKRGDLALTQGHML